LSSQAQRLATGAVIDREGDGRRRGRESIGASPPSPLLLLALSLFSLSSSPDVEGEKVEIESRLEVAESRKAEKGPNPALSCAVPSLFAAPGALIWKLHIPIDRGAEEAERESGRDGEASPKEG